MLGHPPQCSGVRSPDIKSLDIKEMAGPSTWSAVSNRKRKETKGLFFYSRELL